MAGWFELSKSSDNQFRFCNFAFFSGLFDAQFWVGSAQPKSPELTANC